ncbi:uncharacterized protein C4orf50 homolog [Ornithorhynchus anatinus]|uniref:uncharacterized protein C4orf50 homolog n=1 Tax=Ornithorhynchus anatinus TaxID=9258 RepID=UPI0019D4B8A9|nr:uncharacterized protein C4orf50 homolog [Ornithorhynchus anatinus]
MESSTAGRTRKMSILGVEVPTGERFSILNLNVKIDPSWVFQEIDVTEKLSGDFEEMTDTVKDDVLNHRIKRREMSEERQAEVIDKFVKTESVLRNRIEELELSEKKLLEIADRLNAQVNLEEKTFLSAREKLREILGELTDLVQGKERAGKIPAEKFRRLQEQLMVKDEEMKSQSEYFEHYKQNQKQQMATLEEQRRSLQAQVMWLERQVQVQSVSMACLVAQLGDGALQCLRSQMGTMLGEMPSLCPVPEDAATTRAFFEDGEAPDKNPWEILQETLKPLLERLQRGRSEKEELLNGLEKSRDTEDFLLRKLEDFRHHIYELKLESQLQEQVEELEMQKKDLQDQLEAEGQKEIEKPSEATGPSGTAYVAGFDLDPVMFKKIAELCETIHDFLETQDLKGRSKDLQILLTSLTSQLKKKHLLLQDEFLHLKREAVLDPHRNEACQTTFFMPEAKDQSDVGGMRSQSGRKKAWLSGAEGFLISDSDALEETPGELRMTDKDQISLNDQKLRGPADVRGLPLVQDKDGQVFLEQRKNSRSQQKMRDEESLSLLEQSVISPCPVRVAIAVLPQFGKREKATQIEPKCHNASKENSASVRQVHEKLSWECDGDSSFFQGLQCPLKEEKAGKILKPQEITFNSRDGAIKHEDEVQTHVESEDMLLLPEGRKKENQSNDDKNQPNWEEKMEWGGKEKSRFWEAPCLSDLLITSKQMKRSTSMEKDCGKHLEVFPEAQGNGEDSIEATNLLEDQGSASRKTSQLGEGKQLFQSGIVPYGPNNLDEEEGAEKTPSGEIAPFYSSDPPQGVQNTFAFKEEKGKHLLKMSLTDKQNLPPLNAKTSLQGRQCENPSSRSTLMEEQSRCSLKIELLEEIKDLHYQQISALKVENERYGQKIWMLEEENRDLSRALGALEDTVHIYSQQIWGNNEAGVDFPFNSFASMEKQERDDGKTIMNKDRYLGTVCVSEQTVSEDLGAKASQDSKSTESPILMNKPPQPIKGPEQVKTSFVQFLSDLAKERSKCFLEKAQLQKDQEKYQKKVCSLEEEKARHLQKIAALEKDQNVMAGNVSRLKTELDLYLALISDLEDCNAKCNQHISELQEENVTLKARKNIIQEDCLDQAMAVTKQFVLENHELKMLISDLGLGYRTLITDAVAGIEDIVHRLQEENEQLLLRLHAMETHQETEHTEHREQLTNNNEQLAGNLRQVLDEVKTEDKGVQTTVPPSYHPSKEFGTSPEGERIFSRGKSPVMLSMPREPSTYLIDDARGLAFLDRENCALPSVSQDSLEGAAMKKANFVAKKGAGFQDKVSKTLGNIPKTQRSIRRFGPSQRRYEEVKSHFQHGSSELQHLRRVEGGAEIAETACQADFECEKTLRLRDTPGKP